MSQQTLPDTAAKMDKDELKRLAAATGPCLSVLMPWRTTGDPRDNQIRAKGLIRQVEQTLEERGLDPQTRKTLSESFQQALPQPEAHSHPAEAFAIYVSKEIQRVVALPHAAEEKVIIADHFYVRPLLALPNGGYFYILALSQKHVRLLRCTDHSSEEVPLPKGTPTDLQTFNQTDKPDHDQIKSGGAQSGALRGGGSGAVGNLNQSTTNTFSENKDLYLHDFFRAIDRSLHEIFRNETAPLVVAGVEYELADYKRVNTYANTVEGGVHGAPDGLKGGELHKRALEVVQPAFHAAREKALTHYDKSNGAGKASTSVKEIVKAAYDGRVNQLFVTEGGMVDGQLRRSFAPRPHPWPAAPRRRRLAECRGDPDHPPRRRSVPHAASRNARQLAYRRHVPLLTFLPKCSVPWFRGGALRPCPALHLRMAFRRAFLLVLALLPCLPAADSSINPAIILLARARRAVAENVERLPKITCLATVDRYQGHTWELDGPWRTQDRIRLEVALVGQHEFFALPGDTQLRARNPLELIGHGTAGTGEFAVHLKNVFSGANQVSVAGEDTLDGRRAFRYGYTISSVLGRYSIQYAGAGASTTPHGNFWLDAETAQILRIDTFEDDLPALFPIRQAITRTTYGPVIIQHTAVLLPAKSELVLAEANGRAFRNLTQYTHCREFTIESTVSYGEEPPAPAASSSSTIPPAPTRAVTLPANLKLTAILEQEIDAKKNFVGDPISARLAADVLYKGKVVLPEGTQLTGRLRRAGESLPAPESCALAVEFTEVLWEGRRTRFFAQLDRVENAPGFSLQASWKEDLGFPALPGVANIYGPSAHCQLPAGTRLQWHTVQPPDGR